MGYSETVILRLVLRTELVELSRFLLGLQLPAISQFHSSVVLADVVVTKLGATLFLYLLAEVLEEVKFVLFLVHGLV